MTWDRRWMGRLLDEVEARMSHQIWQPTAIESTPPARPRVGIALGGGGARGAAHLGVLRILEQAGIPIDCIAGTSSGAMIGAAYAAGLTVDETEQIFARVRMRDLFRPVWAADGWLDNTPLARSVERLVGHVDVSQLRIPFATVATDAVTGEPVELREGPLANALKATTAIPCLVRPVECAGRRLIDGGVVSKVPVRLARSLGADLVIAVDLSLPYPWQARRIRHPLAFLMRVLEMMDKHLVAGELATADVVLQPEVDCGSFEFHRYREQVRQGEETALRAVEAIRQLIDRAGAAKAGQALPEEAVAAAAQSPPAEAVAAALQSLPAEAVAAALQ